jgi:hypothetical protein
VRCHGFMEQCVPFGIRLENTNPPHSFYKRK